MEIRNQKHTQKHRLAIVSGILGTVYGVNEDGHAQYFDYDREAAYAFAGVVADADPRLSAAERLQYVRSGATECNPTPGAQCVWVLKNERR